jgi:hypothetical protein
VNLARKVVITTQGITIMEECGSLLNHNKVGEGRINTMGDRMGHPRKSQALLKEPYD